MKLVRHTALHYQQGTSDKVYEIDLCEVGPDEYVVNFRYGRRGRALREGSKTVLPVTLERAQAIFDKLASEKTRKGYVDITAPAEPTPPPPVPASTTTARTLDPRAATVLKYLNQPRTRPANWPLSRIAWRAGELGISEAATALTSLLDHADEHTAYSATWALGRVGAAQHAHSLESRSRTGPIHLRRLAEEGRRRLTPEAARGALVTLWRDQLPAGLLAALDAGSLTATLCEWLQTTTGDRSEVVHLLYLLDTPACRDALGHAVRTLPVAPPQFRWMRLLLKSAEFRRDGEFFGLLARRFMKTRHRYAISPWSDRVYLPGVGGVHAREESAEANSRLAYSLGTRKWMMAHLWRVLRRLGELRDPGYADMAAGLLTAFSDEDLGEPRLGWRGRLIQDGYAELWALGHVLFGSGARHIFRRKQLRIGRIDNGSADTPAPDTREAAYPELWDQRPDALFAVLDHSDLSGAHDLAAKAVRANPSLWSQPSTAQLCRWLDRAYPRTVAIAGDIAIDRYDPASPDLLLIGGLCDVADDRVRQTAHGWIRANAQRFVRDTSLMVRLGLSRQADTRSLARETLVSAVLPETTRAAHLEGFFAVLLLLEAPELDDDEEPPADPALRELGSLLIGSFPQLVRNVSLDTIAQLLTHEHPGVQEVGARLLLAHATPAEDLPDAVMAGLLRSGFANIRTIGLQLFGRLPDAVLLERFAVMVHLVANPHADVRQAVQPIVSRLAGAHPAFARSLFGALVPVLGAPESFEGLHADLCRLVDSELGPALDQSTPDQIMALVGSPSSRVAELGGVLLGRQSDFSAFTVRQLADLGSHEVLSIREASWAAYEAAPERIRAELDVALRILDASWEDTRAWAFLWFEAHLTASNLSPERLVALCDGVRPDVQTFGRRMLGLHFESEHGPRVLEMLAEHPTPDMQLYATNYLERYATGDSARVARLVPFFASVLSRVNVGAVAKSRVHTFLAAEALRSRESAAVIAPVLTQISAVCAIANRARCLETLVRIQAAWPGVETGLTLRPVERRSNAV